MIVRNRPAGGARRRWAWLVVALAALTACRAGIETAPPAAVVPVQRAADLPSPTPLLPTPTAVAAAAALPTATPMPTPLPTRTPLVIANPSTACGVLLPVLVADSAEPTTWRPPLIADGVVPDDALPAVTRLLTHPDSAALVVYRLGYEGIGFYHNAARALPLASVVKLVHLVAYAEAVAAGRLDPDEAVPLAELERYYLPRSDLGAHNTALAALRADGRLLDDNRAVRLGDVVWMMVRHSANSATDYLHQRLGQAVIEQTVRDLNLGPHSAPCPFLGQFLTMTNHTRLAADSVVLRELIADPARYAAEATTLADGYVQSADVRSAESATWGRRQHPSITTQRLFTAELSPRGTAGGYADLMAGIVRGSVGSPDANAVIRSYLEWPLTAFAGNADRYSVIGYKNGTLPGVLTTVYYAWPRWSDQPMVVALFFRDLPQDDYQQWRRTLPHDALAHWLMSDPNAVHVLHVLRDHVE